MPHRVYRLLLKLFPASFRGERGGEMERLFGEMYSESSTRGKPFLAWFWARTLVDATIHGIGERITPHRIFTPHRQTLGESMSTLLNDIHFAVRSFVKRPSYALMVITMVALGIAGNAAVFRMFNGLFLRPLPFSEPEQLIDMDETAPAWDLEYVGINYPDFVAWREQNQSFQSMSVYNEGGVTLADENDSERISMLAAQHELTGVLRFKPVLGRFFTAEDDRPDGPSVLLLTYGFWKGKFGGDPEVIGRTLRLNSETAEIIGVLPKEADFLSDAVMWSPLQEDPNDWSGWYLSGVGRLKPGVTIEQAHADLYRIHKSLIEKQSSNKDTSPILQPVRQRALGEYKLGSIVMLGAVGIVLLIACANIAGLMLAQSLTRTREIGIRIALGAGRRRIVRQLLVESLILSLVGGVLGTLLGFFGSSLLISRMAEQFPQWIAFTLDWRFVAFTILVTVGATIVFGLTPALQATKIDTRGVLNASSNRSSAGAGRRRSMNLLVAVEVAMALVLLIVAGLSVRDLNRLQHIDPGFRQDNLLTYRMALPRARYEDRQQRLSFYEQHLARLRALPGVTSATGASSLPLSGHWGWFFEAEGGEPRAEGEPNPVVLSRIVAEDYFRTMGVTLDGGRFFDKRDWHDSAFVAVVNESFVNAFFPRGTDAVGKRIRTGEKSPWITIIGVSRDVKHYGLDKEMRPGVYLPFPDRVLANLMIAVRTAGDPEALASTVRGIVRETDPELAAFDIIPMRKRMNDALWPRLASSWLAFTFSVIALAMAVAGIYGIISHSVRQRMREVSIRMALGARSSQVLLQIMKQGMLLVVAGTVVGLGAAFAISRIISSIFVQVSSTDPLVYAAVTILLLAVAALANFIPARRASRLEPMGVLRDE